MYVTIFLRFFCIHGGFSVFNFYLFCTGLFCKGIHKFLCILVALVFQLFNIPVFYTS